MAIQGDNLSSYMIRPTEWSDTIIRARVIAPEEARVRMHASLFCLRTKESLSKFELSAPSSELLNRLLVGPVTHYLSPDILRGVA